MPVRDFIMRQSTRAWQAVALKLCAKPVMGLEKPAFAIVRGRNSYSPPVNSTAAHLIKPIHPPAAPSDN
jgi:hypothetical protein